MILLKNVIGGALILTGLVTAIQIGWSGAYLSALGTLMMGAVAGCAFLTGILKSFESPIFQFFGGATVLVGVASVFVDSNFTNSHLRDSYMEVVEATVFADQKCNPPPPGFTALKQHTVFACAQQSNSDAGEAVGALTKTLYYSNTVGLIDSANSAFNAKPLRNCGDAFKVMNELCPAAYLSLKPEHRTALLKSASGTK